MTIELSKANGLKVNDEFILKKDLPHMKAGAIFVVKDCHGSDELYLMAINKESIKISDIVNWWEWFERKNENNCVKCNKFLPEYDEFYECKLMYNNGAAINKKVCADCFDSYILTTAG